MLLPLHLNLAAGAPAAGATAVVVPVRERRRKSKKVAVAWSLQQDLKNAEGQRNLFNTLQQFASAINAKLGAENLDPVFTKIVGVQPISGFPTINSSVAHLGYAVEYSGGPVGGFGSSASAVTTFSIGHEKDAGSGSVVRWVQAATAVAGSTFNLSSASYGLLTVRIPNRFQGWETAAIRLQHMIEPPLLGGTTTLSINILPTPLTRSVDLVVSRAVTDDDDTQFHWLEVDATQMSDWGAGDALVFRFSATASANNSKIKFGALEINWR